MNQSNNRQNQNQPRNTYSPVASRLIGNNQSVNKGYSSTSVVGIIILIVVLLVLAAACYWLYQYYTNRSFQTINEVEVMSDVKDAASKFSVGSGSIPTSNYSNEYSISMWINIDNYTYNYGQEKYILCRGNPGSGNPEIVLDAKTNDLIVKLKLQVPTPSIAGINGNSNSGKSNFANIEIPVVMGNLEPAFNNPNSAVPTSGCIEATTILNKVGNNGIDYPIIQYQIANNCNMNSSMREGFANAGLQIAGKRDLTMLSDNSAPVESQHYPDSYFNDISGNEVPANGRGNIAKVIREGFDAIADISNACASVLIDFCNITNMMKQQSTANNAMDASSKAFQSIIDALEASRSTAKTTADIDAAFKNAGSNISSILNNDTFNNLVAKLVADLETLKTVSQGAGGNVSISTIMNTVNTKLAAANCSLVLSGNNDINITTNLYESLLNLIKKSLYTYLNNLSYGIQKEYPELAGQQSASCLIQNTANSDPSIGTCVYKAIPLQRWTHVIVSVYNQVVDIFIDGKLGSSCVLSAFPALSTSDVVITPNGGFAGKISRVTFANTAMTIQHAKELYYDGPVPTSSLWSMIPNWVWYGIIFLIVIAISY
jgi:hypothetical protein